MDKRYQVFVSSTYTDLKEERKNVTQTLMEMDCIPAGMELFPAMDEEQWAFIKKIIDDCDYYLLIIGGRYGTIDSEGVSYTEKEFDYAIEKGLRVIVLIHGTPTSLSIEKSDISEELREKLQNFRDKASTGRLVRFWQNSSDLPGLVALSLTKTIKLFPAIGWVRADKNSSQELLSEINELRKENQRLETLVSDQTNEINIYDIPDLAGLEELFSINGKYYTSTGSKPWVVKIKWIDIFYYISPYLVKSLNQEALKEVLRRAVVDRDSIPNRTNTMSDQDFQTIAIQLKALGLISIKISKSTTGKILPFWRLTPNGEKLMVELRSIKNK